MFDRSVIHHIEHADHPALGEDVQIVIEQLHLDPGLRDGHKLKVPHCAILISRPDPETVCVEADNNQMILQQAAHHVLTVGQEEGPLKVSRCQHKPLADTRETFAEDQKLRLVTDAIKSSLPSQAAMYKS